MIHHLVHVFPCLEKADPLAERDFTTEWLCQEDDDEYYVADDDLHNVKRIHLKPLIQRACLALLDKALLHLPNEGP